MTSSLLNGFAVGLALLGTLQPVCAADLSEPGDPVAADQADPTSQRTFYVRGDFGYAFHDVGGFGQDNLFSQGGEFVSEDVGSTPYIGGGLGWRLSSWLRVDLTGEYRFSADVDAEDYLQRNLTGPAGLLTASTKYKGDYSALVGLANLYVDLPKWHGITPYVGAGLGVSRNRFSDFTTESDGSFRDFATGQVTSATTEGYAGDNSKTSFAWALMAGASLDLSDQLKLDAGYRYLNLGSDIAATTALIHCFCGTIGDPLTASDMEAHEIRIGLRWEFSGREPEGPAPLK